MNTIASEVISAIRSEREYQNLLWGNSFSSGRNGSGDRTLVEFASYVLSYAEKLLEITSKSANPIEKLDHVRKVAGLCVAAIEQHQNLSFDEAVMAFTPCDWYKKSTIDEFAFHTMELTHHYTSSDKKISLSMFISIFSICFTCMAKHGAPHRLITK